MHPSLKNLYHRSLPIFYHSTVGVRDYDVSFHDIVFKFGGSGTGFRDGTANVGNGSSAVILRVHWMRTSSYPISLTCRGYRQW